MYILSIQLNACTPPFKCSAMNLAEPSQAKLGQGELGQAKPSHHEPNNTKPSRNASKGTFNFNVVHPEI